MAQVDYLIVGLLFLFQSSYCLASCSLSAYSFFFSDHAKRKVLSRPRSDFRFRYFVLHVYLVIMCVKQTLNSVYVMKSNCLKCRTLSLSAREAYHSLFNYVVTCEMMCRTLSLSAHIYNHLFFAVTNYSFCVCDEI
jgi:hypothetical protein